MTRHICPPDHKHGQTSTCHSSHRCRCDDCVTAHVEYSFWLRNMRAAGRVAVLDILVDATATRRRIEALAAIGYSQSALGARLGVSYSNVCSWAQSERVRRSTAVRVAELYEQLQNTPATASTPGERLSVPRTLALAQRRGWARPIDWDDIDTDPAPSIDPQPVDDYIDVIAIDLATSATPESPSGLTLTREERHIAVRDLNARGYNDQEISRMLLVADKTIGRDREHLGIPAVEDSWLDRGARKAMAA